MSEFTHRNSHNSEFKLTNEEGGGHSSLPAPLPRFAATRASFVHDCHLLLLLLLLLIQSPDRHSEVGNVIAHHTQKTDREDPTLLYTP